MKIDIKHDKKADSIYLTFSDQKVAYSRKLDSERSVDYSEEGEIRGIQFSSASTGLKTDDLPYRRAIDKAFHDKGIAGIAYKPAISQGNEKSHEDVFASSEIVWNIRINARAITGVKAVGIVLFFSGMVVADVLLMRNLLALSSVPVVLFSVLGLMVTLLPTVFGLLLLFAWIILATGLAKRFENEGAGEDISE